ncbi:Ethanolamine-phosphate cytidylyltransferase [Hibiscus syriacus]|uniref:ethanolamine-phosphate cytidylyltransferase n=1 Tax=Hibiscus syriacus TaxID=106335 RepID=A0A6A3B122_HIBSY|nr:Ethanolamine-phosphate cytidylyltransferase [Hibiscus syriacus]
MKSDTYMYSPLLSSQPRRLPLPQCSREVTVEVATRMLTAESANATAEKQPCEDAPPGLSIADNQTVKHMVYHQRRRCLDTCVCREGNGGYEAGEACCRVKSIPVDNCKILAALLGFSVLFGGIGVFPSYGLSNFGIFLKKNVRGSTYGLALVSGLKWVDQVIANAPYAITEKFMNTLFNEHKIDYIIHGDDPCLLPDGTDAYPWQRSWPLHIKRTEGVSSTDCRILSSMKDNKSSEGDSGKRQQSQRGQLSQFLPTSRRIVQFSNGKGPGPNARIVYIDGAFDLFHAGHVEILKKARQLGDFLLVGIHADHIVSEQRGIPYPVMHLLERTLSVLACRYVDEVIIGAPWGVTKDMGEPDPYAIPKGMGIFRMLESPKSITTSSVAQRIVANHEAYMPTPDIVEHFGMRYESE